MPVPPPDLTPQGQLEADTIACYPTIIRQPQYHGVLYNAKDLVSMPKSLFKNRRDFVIRRANLDKRRAPVAIKGPLAGARIAIVPHGPFAPTHKMTIDLYSMLDFRRAKRIFILCGFHSGYVKKIATPPPTVRGYRTILSGTPWPLDSELITAWNVTGQCECIDVVQDRTEHGIEVPLLYLHKFVQLAIGRYNPVLFPKLIPLFVGVCSPAEAASIGQDLLLPYMKDPESIIIISTDWVKWAAPMHTFYSYGAMNPCPERFNDPTELPQPWPTEEVPTAVLVNDIDNFIKKKGDLLPLHFRTGRRDDLNPDFTARVPDIMNSILTEDWVLMLALTLKPDGGAHFRTVRRQLGQPVLCGIHALHAVLAAIPLIIEESKAVKKRNKLMDEFEGRFIWLSHGRDKTVKFADDYSTGWVCGFAMLP
ncbi:hypothetical protein KEM56_005840 [Ascosphaera pollenicola]|nr:hypothetical protein KEM56_005840 [Ascosphaera pollenicola]